jgi:hypothetical protein
VTREIKYESNTALPPEIRELFRIAGKAFLEHSREPDKTMIIFDNFLSAVTRWFDHNMDKSHDG